MAFQGVYRGVVTDSSDPSGFGRVKVNVPALPGGLGSWAPVCLPLGGGIVARVPVGTPVLVAFEGGDITRPVVLGRFAAGVAPDLQP